MSKENTNAGETEADLVDFSYIIELGGSKPEFIKQVLTIFMENTPQGLKELEHFIRKGRNWDKISKQAHFLKSSVGIVKVRGMHERLQQIETLAREKRDKKVIVNLLDEIVETFVKAEKVILSKLESVS
ncbi:MAG TPA: Hpt domain-containing protein [Flavipsychrobacter sp.]|nr:Hpt domain-containing protein [Flavipsychrobacter sp.]